MTQLSDKNNWCEHLRLGLFETTKFIYGDQVNIKYSKEYAREIALLLRSWSEKRIKS